MNFALIENNIVTNVVVAKTRDDLDNSNWVECPKDLWIGDNYQEYRRGQAYIKEADPLFFKWKRGEATEQEWLDKIAEIKARHQG
jgi:hypothetical protein